MSDVCVIIAQNWALSLILGLQFWSRVKDFIFRTYALSLKKSFLDLMVDRLLLAYFRFLHIFAKNNLKAQLTLFFKMVTSSVNIQSFLTSESGNTDTITILKLCTRYITSVKKLLSYLLDEDGESEGQRCHK